MATYTELADYVSDWSNRATDVLRYDTIRQCVNYAHDEIYRTLRIAPLEFTGNTTIDQTAAEQGYLITPEDLVEFIQLRKDFNGNRRELRNKYVVAEAKSDLRSALGDNLTTYSDYSYVREGEKIWVAPYLTIGETWHLHYYRRLPAPNERWTLDEWVAAEGIDTSSAVVLDNSFNNYFYRWDPNNGNDEDFVEGDPDEYGDTTAFDRDNEITAIHASAINDLFTNVNWTDVSGSYIGRLKKNWLRDENEKVLLFGALYHAFDYLDEPEQVGKFKGKFEHEIAKLNEEERLRQYSGGNLNVNFYNPLI